MYDVIVIGSGISSMCFLDSLNVKNKKVAIISYKNNKLVDAENNYKETFFNQNLPPRFSKNNEKDYNALKNFFIKNNIKFNKNSSIFGILNPGGVSNYWGSSCHFPPIEDLNFLNDINKKELINSFDYLYKKYNFTGFYNSKLNFKKKYNYENNKILNMFQKCSNTQIQFYENCLAYDNISNVSFSPKNNGNKIFNKAQNLNYFVRKILKENDIYKIYCEGIDDNKEIILVSKKIVLAAGTLVSTKLVGEMLKTEENFNLDHNPMLFGVFLFKKSIKENSFLPSKIAAEIHSDKSEFTAIANLRGSNDVIKDKIFQNYFFMKNFFSKYLYNIIDDKLLFVNLYLDSDRSCLSFKKDKNNFFNVNIKLERLKSIKNELKYYYNKLYKVLRRKNMIYPFKYVQIPKMGTDNHYTGTIPINSSCEKFSLNENCELKNYSGLYIIDGSAIPKNSSKFPTCIIMANAHRVGKLL